MRHAYGGYNELYKVGRPPGPFLEAGRWAHARRKFFELADIEATDRKTARGEQRRAVYSGALEAVCRIDALFAIERRINGASPAQRLAVRRAESAPLVIELETWLAEIRQQLISSHAIAKAINYLKRRWPSFTRFLEDGRVCLSNNAAKRALRGIAFGRKAGLFCGSDRGRPAGSNDVQPDRHRQDVDLQAWLADVLARINDLPRNRMDELLPWNWRGSRWPAGVAVQ